jgi:hypothetical protein
MTRELNNFIHIPDNIDNLNVGTIEDWISKEPYNQVLYLLMLRKKPDYLENDFSIGIHNSLTPFLFNPDYLVNISSVEKEIFSDSDKNDVLLFQEPVFKANNPENELSGIPLNQEPELHMTENNDIRVESIMITPKNLDMPKELTPEVKDKGNDSKNIKKRIMEKNNIPADVVGNSYTDWLQLQKPIYAYSKKKKKKNDPVLMSAQKSITPSEEIISEPLAKILFIQGHYLEAKLMYKKLSIKYPESTEKYIKEINEINEKLSNKS